MIKPTWIIETGVFGESIQPLIEEIQRQGMAYHLVSYRDLAHGFGVTEEKQTACVICYCSHPFMHHVQKHYPHWIPGGWCDFQNLACTGYYPYFGPYLLNQPYTLLSGVEAIRLRDWLFAQFGEDNRVFVRPSSVEKVIPGRCVSQEEWATALAPTRYDPSTLVMVARPQAIEREWRVVVGEQIVAASRYMDRGDISIEPDCPSSILEFVAKLLQATYWRPDDLFIMDVCETANGLHLLECNAFSCSGLYACNLAAIVEAASEAAYAAYHSTLAC